MTYQQSLSLILMIILTSTTKSVSNFEDINDVDIDRIKSHNSCITLFDLNMDLDNKLIKLIINEGMLWYF